MLFDRIGKQCTFWGAPVVDRVERVPLRPNPYRSDRSSIPALGPLLQVFSSHSHTFLPYSTIKRIKPSKNLKWIKKPVYILTIITGSGYGGEARDDEHDGLIILTGMVFIDMSLVRPGFAQCQNHHPGHTSRWHAPAVPMCDHKSALPDSYRSTLFKLTRLGLGYIACMLYCI